MKIYCRGFNACNQLNASDFVVKEFTQTFNNKDIEDFRVSHTFSVLKTKNSVEFLCKRHNINIKELLDKTQINDVCEFTLNENSIYFLTKQGKIYKLKLNKSDSIVEISTFTTDKISIIANHTVLNVAYTENGNMYSNGVQVFKNPDIVDIQVGIEHCILLDKHGNVYTFGRGSRGQLGHGTLSDLETPQQVEVLAGLKITKISAGGWHCCALSDTGDLYTWGWNCNGQLGLGEEEKKAVMASPCVVLVEDEQANVVEVACGNRHTIALLENGDLYGCGWNKYKQLKNSEEENYKSFTYLCNWSSESVVKLVCGTWNSCVICK